MSAEQSPSAASALLSVSSSVCCVTLLEADAAEGEVDAESDAASEVSAADDADAFFEVETVCALEPDPPVPLDEPEFVLLPVWSCSMNSKARQSPRYCLSYFVS